MRGVYRPREQPDVQRYPDDTRRAPAKPPAQPVGMTESKRKRTSWQKPACTPLHIGGESFQAGSLTMLEGEVRAALHSNMWTIRPMGWKLTPEHNAA
jgi:hypothetical protein